MIKFIEAIRYAVAVPTAFSAFHIIAIAMTVAVAVFLCARFSSSAAFSAIILVIWAVIAIMEVVKQFYVSFKPNPFPHFSYNAEYFPFQLCSTPLYTLPVVALTAKRKNAVFDAFASYTAIFPFFGGLTVMINPSTVFSDSLYLNVQTMIHHGAQIIAGVYIAVWCRKRYDLKFFFKGVFVLLGAIAVAIIINAAAHDIYDGYFNMFYISPYFYDDVPTFGNAFKSIPYPLVAAGYSASMTAIGFAIFLTEKLLFDKLGKKSKQ